MPRNVFIPFCTKPWTGPSAVRTDGAFSAAFAWGAIMVKSRPARAAVMDRAECLRAAIDSLPLLGDFGEYCASVAGHGKSTTWARWTGPTNSRVEGAKNTARHQALG